MSSSQKRNLILVIGIAAIVAVSVFLSIPNPTIAPAESKVTFGPDGGIEEVAVITDANYSKWHVNSSGSWVKVSKNYYSITIECSPNRNRENRSGYIYLSCDGRSRNEERIKVVQDGSNRYVAGEIIGLNIKHNVKEWDPSYQEYKMGMTLTVECNVRNTRGEDIKCCIWFYNSDGSKLESVSNNSRYRTTDGQITIQDKFYFVDGEYDEAQLFIPYSEFPAGNGYYCNVGLIEYNSDSNGCQFADKAFESTAFTVSR